mgnify:CR=1 FL=1
MKITKRQLNELVENILKEGRLPGASDSSQPEKPEFQRPVRDGDWIPNATILDEDNFDRLLMNSKKRQKILQNS